MKGKKRRINFRRIGKRITYALFVFLFVLTALEISYRYQWIDFFKSEFKALNTEVKEGRSNVLLFGDSFTAHPNGYVELLRSRNTNYNFINTAIPGTGPIEMSLLAEGRVNEYSPELVIYQMYIGNDLLDITPIKNWGQLSFSRNLYWSSKSWFQIFGLLSRRWNGAQTDFDITYNSQEDIPFSIGTFSPRTKMLIKADPEFVEKSITDSEYFEDARDECVERIQYLEELLPDGTTLYVVVLPHFSQVNEEYQRRFVELGASETTQTTQYPFINYMEENLPGIHVVNPLEFIRLREANGCQMYYENDPHFSGDGQAAFATFLEQEILMSEHE